MTALAVVWALVAAGFSVVAWWRLGRRRPDEPLRAAPPVLLLRPADGVAPHELANLARPVEWAGPLEHVVLAPERPALPGSVRWLPSDPPGPNRKVGHLLHAVRTLGRPGHVVLAVDADVAVDAALVRALVAPLLAGAALVTAPPEPMPGRGPGTRAVRALLRHTHLAFRAVDAMRIGPRAVCGKAMALGPPALALLPAVADRVGEDLELAARLHAAGARVALTGTPARMPAPPHGVSLRDAVARFGRWMQVLRAHRPALFATVPWLLTPTLPLVALAALAGDPMLGGAVAALVGARAALAARLGPGDASGWPLGEALLLAAFVWALGARRVRWRGRTYRLERGGRMAACGAGDPPSRRLCDGRWRWAAGSGS
jgi:hypothetical protein